MISSNYQHLLPYVVAWMTGVWIVMVKKWMVDPSCYLASRLVERWLEEIWHTVDGRNPAPVDMVNIPLLTWFCTSLVVQDFIHQQYHQKIPTRFDWVILFSTMGQRSKRREKKVDIWYEVYIYMIFLIYDVPKMQPFGLRKMPLKSMRGWCLEGFGIIKTGQDECAVEPKLLKSSLFARTI